jgi:hypothetical protein
MGLARDHLDPLESHPMAYLFKRGRNFYLKYYVGGRQKEISLRTDVLQIAKEKRRQFESGRARGEDNPLPTRTPLAQVIGAYLQHIRAVKTGKSAQNDTYYLREAFGPICPELETTSRSTSPSYRRAIARGCDLAFPWPQLDGRRIEDLSDDERKQLNAWQHEHHWHPHQLRHNAATFFARSSASKPPG